MKINKKIIVSTMALSMGAALAGSVSGTIAWYQYSTRSTVSMLGTSVGLKQNLQIKIGDGEWKSDLKQADITAYLATANKADTKFVPVTAGGFEKDAAIPSTGFKRNPIYQQFSMDKWTNAKSTDYVVLPLKLRIVDNNGGTQDTYRTDGDIYLSGVTIKADKNNETGKGDISNALRVHFATESTKALFANVAETETSAYLDLNGDKANDTAQIYEFDDEAEATKYGVPDSKQTSYVAATDTTVLANDADPEELDGGKSLGKSSEEGLPVTVTIWVEGWQKLGDKVLWDPKVYADALFDVGMTFTYQGQVL